ncbi:MAG: hypothetical protein Q8N23_01160 [Archangium sp.]|nr:hypothetical protein [Archangium sp.]MDP3570114.1 hypothetical protein [Archangium sp.]
MEEEIARMAAEAVAIAAAMKLSLDYSEKSIPRVESALAAVAEHFDSLDDAGKALTAQRFGCYLLVVGQRTYGGRYQWNEERNQPVLVVGEPNYRVAIITWDKVTERLEGDQTDDITFFWAGFAMRAKAKTAGSDFLFV